MKLNKIVASLFLLFIVIFSNAKTDSLIHIFNNSKIDSIRIDALKELGNEYRSKGDFLAAIDFFEKVIENCNTDNNYSKITKERILAISKSNIGIVYYYIGDYEQANSNFFDALDIYEKLIQSNNQSVIIEGKHGVALSFLSIGVVNFAQENYEVALDYYNKSLKINLELENDFGLADCYNNIGTVYVKQNKLDNAIEHFLLALEYNKKIQNETGISACYTNIAIIYIKKKDYEESEKYYLKSLEIEKKLDNKYGISLVYSNLSVLYQELADSVETNTTVKIDLYKKAIDFAEKAYDLAKEIESLEIENISVECLFDTYEGLARLKIIEKDFISATELLSKSLKFSKIGIEIRKKIFTEEKTKAILELEIRYQLDKKEKENLILRQKVELGIYRQNMLIIVIISTIILVLLFVLNQINYRKRKEGEKNKILSELKIVKAETIIKKSVDELTPININKEKIDLASHGKLNETDWKIINVLYKTPIITNKALAENVCLSIDGVRSSLRKMYGLFDIKNVDNQKIALVIEIMKHSR